MDWKTRMKRIRMINKMNEDPTVSRKPGLKDRSYTRGGKEAGHEIVVLDKE